jgi:hypothetical protein
MSALVELVQRLDGKLEDDSGLDETPPAGSTPVPSAPSVKRRPLLREKEPIARVEPGSTRDTGPSPLRSGRSAGSPNAPSCAFVRGSCTRACSTAISFRSWDW